MGAPVPVSGGTGAGAVGVPVQAQWGCRCRRSGGAGAGAVGVPVQQPWCADHRARQAEDRKREVPAAQHLQGRITCPPS